jgi:hypothetical protein
MEECRGVGGGERVGRLESAIALRWFPVGSLGQEFPLKGRWLVGRSPRGPVHAQRDSMMPGRQVKRKVCERWSGYPDRFGMLDLRQ